MFHMKHLIIAPVMRRKQNASIGLFGTFALQWDLSFFNPQQVPFVLTYNDKDDRLESLSYTNDRRDRG